MTNEEFIRSIALPGEEWRDVVGYEGSYAVSSFGRIAAIRSHYEYRRNGRLFLKEMTPHLCGTSIAPSTNYERITFKQNCVRDTRLVHRVVAQAFLPNPEEYTCIDHIDDNPSNNKADNLQWCDYKINNSKEHHRTAAAKCKIGQPAPNRKKVVQLLDGQVIRILDSMTEAEIDGFSHSAIHRACNGRLRSHGGYQWMYLSDYESQVSMSKNSNPNPTDSYAASGDTSCKIPE